MALKIFVKLVIFKFVSSLPDPKVNVNVDLNVKDEGGCGGNQCCPEPEPIPDCPVICTHDKHPGPLVCGGTDNGWTNKTFFNRCYLDAAVKCHPAYANLKFKHEGGCALRPLTRSNGGCDCDYHAGGCRISKAASANNACHCSYKGFWTCEGSVVGCQDDNSEYCKNPGRDYNSCQQGGGDCGGYTCDCDYHSGGCTVSAVAPVGNACHCSYKGFYTCGGSIVGCKDLNSASCTNPGKDYNSCEQGGGDCGGYSCDCDYHSGGCTISEAAPTGNACHCTYKGFFTCGGSIVGCKDSSSQYCITPDKSKPSCDQGGGDCGGY